MNILVIGQNGREHVLANTYAKSKRVSKVFMTPGNGLTDYTNPKIKIIQKLVCGILKKLSLSAKKKK